MITLSLKLASIPCHDEDINGRGDIKFSSYIDALTADASGLQFHEDNLVSLSMVVRQPDGGEWDIGFDLPLAACKAMRDYLAAVVENWPFPLRVLSENMPVSAGPDGEDHGMDLGQAALARGGKLHLTTAQQCRDALAVMGTRPMPDLSGLPKSGA
jgi:hypothetical protein